MRRRGLGRTEDTPLVFLIWLPVLCALCVKELAKFIMAHAARVARDLHRYDDVTDFCHLGP